MEPESGQHLSLGIFLYFLELQLALEMGILVQVTSKGSSQKKGSRGVEQGRGKKKSGNIIIIPITVYN
jgi:hypothetical protein